MAAELLDKVKRWEESELSGLNEKAPSSALSLSPKKKLAPLNEGGPVQLLKLQVTSNTGITCYYIQGDPEGLRPGLG